jgi:hypothetical protein
VTSTEFEFPKTKQKSIITIQETGLPKCDAMLLGEWFLMV